jgi:hypothetical protein
MLAAAEIEQAGHTRLYELSEKEFNSSMARMTDTMRKEFPGAEETVDYMVAMLWHMPYVR